VLTSCLKGVDNQFRAVNKREALVNKSKENAQNLWIDCE
jgi:hypothetical protein